MSIIFEKSVRVKPTTATKTCYLSENSQFDALMIRRIIIKIGFAKAEKLILKVYHADEPVTGLGLMQMSSSLIRLESRVQTWG